MGKIEKTAKAVKKGAKWFLPIGSNLEYQVKVAFKNKEIQKAYSEYSGSKEDFVESLKRYINIENYKNSRLKKTGAFLDAGNKALVPVDTTLDAFSIFAGIGTAAKGVITLGKLPAYLAYNAYYLAKTKDLKGTLKNIGYELTSWIVPGSITHLINRYSKQVNQYAAKKGATEYLKKVQGLEKKLLGEEEKPKDAPPLAA